MTLRVGDEVAVLSACRLPKVEEVLGYGTVERITNDLYWVSGFPCARSASVLRKVAPHGIELCCDGADVRKTTETEHYVLNNHTTEPIRSRAWYECAKCGRRLRLI